MTPADHAIARHTVAAALRGQPDDLDTVLRALAGELLDLRTALEAEQQARRDFEALTVKVTSTAAQTIDAIRADLVNTSKASTHAANTIAAWYALPWRDRLRWLAGLP